MAHTEQAFSPAIDLLAAMRRRQVSGKAHGRPSIAAFEQAAPWAQRRPALAAV